MRAPVRRSAECDGQIERLVLDRPRGNILDAEMVAALRESARDLSRALESGTRPQLKLLVLEGEGDHFSFGASVAEHLPEQVERMLAEFHALFLELEALGLPSAAVVRGQCLGGGLELAAWCGTVICGEDARFGLPEVRLGVFPPVAAVMLPWRTGGARAAELQLTGRVIAAAEAVRLGLADECAEAPEAKLLEWFERELAPRSAVALRFAWRAARRPVAQALREELPAVEELYLRALMPHADPREGILAFLERREPRWTHR